MTRSDYRPRTGTEIIDAAFQLIKSHFTPIVTISAIGCVPVLLAHVLYPTPSPAQHGGIILTNVAAGVTTLLLEGSLLYALSEAYLGRPVTVGASVSSGLRNIGRLFLVNFAKSLLIGLAFLLLIVPGFIVFAWLFLTSALVVIEGAPLTSETLSRSRTLCNDTKLRILGFGAIFFVVLMVVGMVAGVAVALTKSLALAGFIWALAYFVALPVYTALMVVQYYDARIRKEGYDVELMAGTLPSSAAPQPSTI